MDGPHHLGQPVNEPGTAPAPATPEPRRYNLFVRHRTGIFWRLRDEGIVPGPENLSYPIDGRWGFRPYSDIHSVSVSTAHVPRSGAIAQCGILFLSGATLYTSTANAQGLPDPERNETFREFLVDFHRRLIEAGVAGRISFRTGTTPGRAIVLNIALAAGVLIFVVLPLVLALMVRSWEPFEIMLGGLLFLWPAWETAQKNQPGTYNPAYPPDLIS